jgi:photosystem II stability/assembly factor-like uncharacterized protein
MLLSACSSAEEPGTATPSSAQPELSALNHVHGVAVDPADGAVLVATHGGLFRLSADGDARIGLEIDLMGFVVVGPGHYVASGHPGPGVDLPQPVGLIESTDGGNTWKVLSRDWESDFHALTSTERGILGYDGSLLRTDDGRDWEELQVPAAPAALAATADGQRVLATTDEGMFLSPDAGTTWSPIDAPVLQFVDWAPDGRTAVGVEPTGAVWVTEDGTASWQRTAHLEAPQAMDVATAADGALRVLVVTASAIVESRDGGRTFTETHRN